MRRYIFLLIVFFSAFVSAQNMTDVKVGAEMTDRYFPLLKGKRVAVMTNQTGMAGDEHLVDVHVANLRRKVRDDSTAPWLIETIPQAGYRLVASRDPG